MGEAADTPASSSSLERQIWCQRKEQGEQKCPGYWGGEKGRIPTRISLVMLHAPESQEAGSRRVHAGNTPLTLTYVLYMPIRVAKSAAFQSPRRQLLSGVQAGGCTRLSPRAWRGAGLSCRPGDRGAVLLRLHPQGSDAGGLAVRLAVQLVAIEAGAHPGRAEEAAHVSLSHVAAGPEELGDAAGRVGMSMGGHAGGHRLAGDHAGGHRGGGSVVADPGGVLDLGMGEEASGVSQGIPRGSAAHEKRRWDGMWCWSPPASDLQPFQNLCQYGQGQGGWENNLQ